MGNIKPVMLWKWKWIAYSREREKGRRDVSMMGQKAFVPQKFSGCTDTHTRTRVGFNRGHRLFAATSPSKNWKHIVHGFSLGKQGKPQMQISNLKSDSTKQDLIEILFNITLLSLHLAGCCHLNRERNSQNHITPKTLHRGHKQNKTYQHTRKYLHAPLPRRPDWILQGICILQHVTSSL